MTSLGAEENGDAGINLPYNILPCVMLPMIVSRTLSLHKKHFNTEKAKIGKNDQSIQS